MELISREEAIVSLEDMRGEISEDGYLLVYRIDAVDRLRTVRTIEKRTEGEWIPYLPEYEDMFKCSECEEIVRLPFKAIRMPYEYCPYCGAKMGRE